MENLNQIAKTISETVTFAAFGKTDKIREFPEDIFEQVFNEISVDCESLDDNYDNVLEITKLYFFNKLKYLVDEGFMSHCNNTYRLFTDKEISEMIQNPLKATK